MIAGWMLASAWKRLAGELVGLTRPPINAVWPSFLARPVTLEAWPLAFLGFVTVISGRGLNRGIEVANRIRSPALLSMLLGLVAHSLLTGDAQRALHFAFAPSFDSISGAGVLAAIGQAFYSTGVGMAMKIAFGEFRVYFFKAKSYGYNDARAFLAFSD